MGAVKRVPRRRVMPQRRRTAGIAASVVAGLLAAVAEAGPAAGGPLPADDGGSLGSGGVMLTGVTVISARNAWAVGTSGTGQPSGRLGPVSS